MSGIYLPTILLVFFFHFKNFVLYLASNHTTDKMNAQHTANSMNQKCCRSDTCDLETKDPRQRFTMLYRYLGFIINLTELKRLSDTGSFAFFAPKEFLAESRLE